MTTTAPDTIQAIDRVRNLVLREGHNAIRLVVVDASIGVDERDEALIVGHTVVRIPIPHATATSAT